jgi:hypothetical protein
MVRLLGWALPFGDSGPSPALTWSLIAVLAIGIMATVVHLVRRKHDPGVMTAVTIADGMGDGAAATKAETAYHAYLNLRGVSVVVDNGMPFGQLTADIFGALTSSLPQAEQVSKMVQSALRPWTYEATGRTSPLGLLMALRGPGLTLAGATELVPGAPWSRLSRHEAAAARAAGYALWDLQHRPKKKGADLKRWKELRKVRGVVAVATLDVYYGAPGAT